MEIIETFGHYVENLTDKKPQSARRLLKTGWEAQNLKFRYMQDKRLMPADRHLANLMMDTMLWPLQKPEDSVIVSIFTPCEMMQEVGLHPYNVEGFSCYLSASKAERTFLQQAENQGIAETLCSYHKTFLGAAQKGLLPKPKCIVYTNLTCDANLLTFRTLADFYQVPVFAIDVPWNQTTENVQYVADQLKDLKIFLEKNTGKTISEDRLKERLACSKRTLENYKKYQQMRADRYVPSDLVTPLYAGMTNNILLGTAEEEKYTQMLLEDIKKAPAAKGKHIYWMHTIPFWSDAVRQELCFSEKAQFVGCELAETCEPDFDPENPFEAMAERMVYHSLNGSALRRIEAGIRHAKQAGADGAVWFGHWGCKHTLGAAQLAKKKFEEAGLTALLGSGFDPGVTQAYCAYAKKHEFDTIDTIDILDCNGGDHGYAFATNFNPEINLREVSAPGSYLENGHWVEFPAMSIKREYNFDQVGDKDMYLLHHEEIESLAKNIPEAKRIRFFMTFGQSYLDHMRCLEDVGMLSTTPVNFNGQEIVPIQFLTALLPDPASLGPRTKGKTNIGCIFTGKKDGKDKTYYIYNVCDHQECYKEVGSQAISYTTGVPAMCGALMLLTGKWTTKGVHTVEEFDPDPYLDALDKYGLPRSESHNPALVD